MTDVRRRRRAVTLLELMIVVMLLGMVAGVTALAIRRLPPPDPHDPYVAVQEARRTAMTRGTSVVIQVRLAGTPYEVSVRPDGQVQADSALHLDPLTGRQRDATR